MIWTESESHSTHENAVFSAAILRNRGISEVALVVDATSMPRAAACFRNSKIHILAAPCTFDELGPWQEEILPTWKALRSNEDTLHELGGLIWYRIRGWI